MIYKSHFNLTLMRHKESAAILVGKGTEGRGRRAVTNVRFYDSVDDALLRFAVILARHEGQWVFCRHRARDTWEVPGGHREPGEAIDETARRELHEETGALDFDLRPVCVYSVSAPEHSGGEETFGLLYGAEVRRFEAELHCEIEKIVLLDELPEKLTYPETHPKLIAEAARRGFPPRDAGKGVSP